MYLGSQPKWFYDSFDICSISSTLFSAGEGLARILSPLLGTELKKNMDQLERSHQTVMKVIEF